MGAESQVQRMPAREWPGCCSFSRQGGRLCGPLTSGSPRSHLVGMSPTSPATLHPETVTTHSRAVLVHLMLLPGQLASLHLSIPKCFGKSLSPVSSSRPVWGMEESKSTRAGQAVGCCFKAQGKSQVHHLAGNVGAFMTYQLTLATFSLSH